MNTTLGIDSLIRENIKALRPYTSARDECMGENYIYLDANESAYDNMVQASSTYSLNRYPDPDQSLLKNKMSSIYSVPKKSIFIGHGSDEIIDLVMRTFCHPSKDEVLFCPPTYGMYSVMAQIHNVSVVEVPLINDFKTLDIDSIKKAANVNCKILFLCSPNNPTGNCFDQESIIKLLNSFKGIVVIDEAYIDFCPQDSCKSLLADYPRLIIMRTFSKAWGLAALRLGFAFAHPKIVEVLSSIKPPYNISTPTQKIALDALDNIEQKNSVVAMINEQRQFLAEQFDSLNCVEKVYPGQANFLLVRFKNAREAHSLLLENRIVIRDRSQLRNCEGLVRITVGTVDENKLLLNVLKKLG
ncbi:MAG: histidinol-phosphate transaminase [Bacteriovoracaceae bacterium]|nr:histidinol-phosphate transaminase [Bacteriovoracaceae bacterium]